MTCVHPPSPPLLPVSHRHQLLISPTPTFSKNPSHIIIIPLRLHANRRWDSNAETFRTNNFDFDSPVLEDEDDDDSSQWADILEDFFDGVSIFKIFRSFGWMLPAMISSFLLTSGPQAFLMALAIPLGQSALSLLFQTIWGRPKTKTRRRGKSKRRPSPPQPPCGASYMDEEDEQEEEYVERERKRATGYQTWVGGGESSGDKTNGESSSFGGWEELDGRGRRRYTNNNNNNGNRKQSKSKMSRRVKRSETPLLLRLLIAVFPFLGSWTKLL